MTKSVPLIKRMYGPLASCPMNHRFAQAVITHAEVGYDRSWGIEIDRFLLFQTGTYLIVNGTEILPLPASHEDSYCLQFWYSAVGNSKKTLKTDHDENHRPWQQPTRWVRDYRLLLWWRNEVSGEFWKLLQRNISSLSSDRIIFGDESSDEDYHHLVIDDLSITTGTCDNFVQQGQAEVDPKRKRRQASQGKARRAVNDKSIDWWVGCSQVIDLMPSSPARSITSPNYPNLYTKQCAMLPLHSSTSWLSNQFSVQWFQHCIVQPR